MTDELLFRNLDYFESLNIPFCVINNTLLGLYRDGVVFPSEARQTVFLAPAHCWKLIRGQGKAYFTNESYGGYGAIDMVEKICVNFYVEQDNKIVINPAENRFFVYEKDIIFPFARLLYKGRQIPVPNKVEDYLSQYYGEWRVRVDETKWNWTGSKFIIYARSPEEAVVNYRLSHESTA